MYNGFHIIRYFYIQFAIWKLKFSSFSPELEIFESYQEEHTSIAYGIDWLGDSDKLASVSFYDNLLTIWQSRKINSL